MKILFLDIDGCLNDHSRHPNGYCYLQLDKLDLLDKIVTATHCRIVLVSAWRYMITQGSMNLKGFGNLMYTHGATKRVVENLFDYLPEDFDKNDPHDRGKLAKRWLTSEESGYEPIIAVALDDGSWPDGNDLGYEACGIPSVRPKPLVGLTISEVLSVIVSVNMRNQ